MENEMARKRLIKEANKCLDRIEQCLSEIQKTIDAKAKKVA